MSVGWEVREGDAVARLREMAEASVDAVVCDPPYGLEFMGKDWDRLGGARIRQPSERDREPGAAHNGSTSLVSRNLPDAYVAGARMQEWHEAWAREALRVLKPGGHVIAAGGSRTYHRLTAGIEDAGFEIRDCITWLFGSGFPKALNVSEALRKLPACACDVPRESGTVDPAEPAGAVGAGVGAELGAVSSAGVTADAAVGHRSDVRSDTTDASANVEAGVEQVVGDGSPVVLGPGTVAGVAAGDEVGTDVGSVQIDPEPLRDQMVGEDRNASAVDARAIGGDCGANAEPADALVLPLATAPSGIVGASEPSAVGDGHAGPVAVDRDTGAGADAGGSAIGADEGARHPLKCDRCGGVRRQMIPNGYGTALKPAAEFWVVARKPLVGTVAGNVLAFGTGALNVDGCRVGTSKQVPASPARLVNGTALSGSVDGSLRRCTGDEAGFDPAVGRWPANVVLAHSEGCRLVGERRVASDGHFPVARGASGYGAAVEGSNGGGLRGQAGLEERFFAGELVEVWECVEGCAVQLLDEQTGELVSGANPTRRGSDKFRGVYGDFAGQEGCKPSRGVDVGGASRFFYTAKASRAERNAGLREGLPRARRRRKRWQQDAADRWWPRASNSHPTVKPVDLMRWLVRLVTPPGGVVLDPFAGSGTTGCAATLEGFRFIGVERDAEYVRIARARIGWWAENPAGMPTVRILSAAVARPAPEQQSLWAALG